MGSSPQSSVLNEWCQAHDCKNLFVADSGPFVSNAHKNMTWTILALSMRTSEHIVEERRKGNLCMNGIDRRVRAPADRRGPARGRLRA